MNSKLKENIGSYIWRKFGTLGYLTGAQLFKARQFTHLVWILILGGDKSGDTDDKP